MTAWTAPSPVTPVRPPSTLPEAAHWYAERGWHVFPVAAEGKTPITNHGHLDATTNVDQITAWWSTHPTARIGVHLRASGLVAIDVDPRNGGADTFTACEAQYGRLPRTMHQRSGGNGEHIVMRDPAPGDQGWTRTGETGGSIRGKLDRLGHGKGVDVKCNSYILVEPSPGYAWLMLSIANAPPVPTPWVEALRKPERERATDTNTIDACEAWATSTNQLTEKNVAQLRDQLAGLRRSEGKAATFKAITAVHHDWGLSLADGAPYIDEWNANCGKPHDDAALQRQIERVAEKLDEPERPRGWRSAAGALSDRFQKMAAASATNSPVPAVDAFAIATKPQDMAPPPPPAQVALCPRARDVFGHDRRPLITYTTGLPEFDRALGGGLQTRSQTGLVARTGVGKTGLVLGIGTHVMRMYGIPCLYVSSELDADESAARAAALLLNQPHADVLNGSVSAGDACRAIDDLPLHLIDCNMSADHRGRNAINLIEIQIGLIEQHYGKKPLVIVDFVQELAAPATDDDGRGVRTSVSAMARQLRALCQRADVAMLTVSSTSRGFYRVPKDADPDDPITYLGAAKESGDLEFAFVNLVFVDVASEYDADRSYSARMIIAKARRAGPGIVGARFHGPTGRWTSDTSAVRALSGERRRVSKEEQQFAGVKTRILEAVTKYGPLSWSSGNGTSIKALSHAGNLGTKARDELLQVGALAEVDEPFPDSKGRKQSRKVLVLGTSRDDKAAMPPEPQAARVPTDVPPHLVSIANRTTG